MSPVSSLASMPLMSKEFLGSSDVLDLERNGLATRPLCAFACLRALSLGNSLRVAWSVPHAETSVSL